MPKPTLMDLSGAAARMMDEFGLAGQVDVKMDGAGHTQWIGKPWDEDFHLVVTLEPMPKLTKE